MRLLCCLFAFYATAVAQPCRITPLTSAEPLRIQEGEPATESDAFFAQQMALGPNDSVYFADSTGRIRTIDADGRLRTLAGNGKRGTILTGAALASPMPAIAQVAVSPAGAVHFSSGGRLYRVDDGRIVVVAGSGRAGFNGEAAPPLDLNLGGIVSFAFDAAGVLYLADTFLRIRRLDADGLLRTFAGSSTPYEFGASNGDGGPATRASFRVVRQVIPLRNGTVWIRDLGTLQAVNPDGNIRVLNASFDPAAEILLTPEGSPVAAAPNRLTPVDPNGQAAPPLLFPGFTGNPRAIGSRGLYAINTNVLLVSGLYRWRDGASTLIAAAPRRTPSSGTGTDAFGVWVEQTSSLIHRGTLDGVNGLVEARAGQPPRLLAGRGTDTGDAEGKPLATLALPGLAAFAVDNEGRLVLLDTARLRVLIVNADGAVTSLKDASQGPAPIGPIGIFSGAFLTPQRIAVDAAGNIYWALPGPPGPSGPASRVSVWTRSTATVSAYFVDGFDGIVRLPNGNVAAIAGPSIFERTLRRLEATRPGDVEAGLEDIGFQSATVAGDTPYFVNALRLFRGRPGSVEAFLGLFSPTEPDRPLFATFVLATARGLVLKAGDGAFYQLENPDACARESQPNIAEGGVLNAAGFGYPNSVSLFQLVTVFGSGLGPPEGQGIILDGLERAASQPGPYPSLLLGQRHISGGLAGIPLPVVFANDTQMTVQVPFVPPNFDILYWSWNGLLLKYAKPIRVQTSTPGIFVQGDGRGGLAAALNQDNSVNSLQRPAPKGSIVQFFLTGLGGLRPPLDGPGAFNSTTTIQRSLESVTARIAAMPATVEFAGAAPGYIGGLYQVNVRIPSNSAAGAQSVEFEVAGQSTSAFQKVTIQLE